MEKPNDEVKIWIDENGHNSAPHDLFFHRKSRSSSSSGPTLGQPSSVSDKTTAPIAVCGMSMRLPGGISSADQFWDFLVNKRDARAPIPPERYATHGPQGNNKDAGENKPHWRNHGYMLDHVDLAAFDASLFSMTRSELARADPQQRLLLELTRECFENAGETNWRGKDIGVYVGSFGEDWSDLQAQDNQDNNLYKVTGAGDFVLSNRISYEYDLKGPSMTVRTACSASLYGLHLACQALQNGDISSALVGGTNLNINPTKTETMFSAGVLSQDASCKSFDAAANGYARGEAVNMVFVKRLDDALRDGNPIRAIIRGTSANGDGKTAGLTKPSTKAHEALIRSCYRGAGLDHEFGSTAFFECHATGTASGDPIEATAVANVFGEHGGVYIGSVKPNMGHSEGASGLTSLIKCILALENKVIPPNIKFDKPNPKIPFDQGRLQVPTDSIPWPTNRKERASVNSFGVGGANAHVIVDSAASFGVAAQQGEDAPGTVTGTANNRLLALNANHMDSLRRGTEEYSQYIAAKPEALDHVAYGLGVRREHLPYRTFAVANRTTTEKLDFSTPIKVPLVAPEAVFVFTGQGAQWATMGADLLSEYPSAVHDLALMDETLSALGPDLAPDWSLAGELAKPKETSRVHEAEFSQPLCAAIQIIIVNLLRDWGISPAAVIGHSSGEIGAAYASGALDMQEAIICAYLRGRVTKQQTTRAGAMAAVGLGSEDIQPFLVDGVVVACENSPSSITLSGDAENVDVVLQTLQNERPEVFARRLRISTAYHCHHMKELGPTYETLLSPYISSKAPLVPFFSTVTNEMIYEKGSVDAQYWRSNLESPVLFSTGVRALLEYQGPNNTLVEIGPHSALSGYVRQILKDFGAESVSYLPTLIRESDGSKALLTTAGHLFTQGLKIRFDAINPAGRVLTDLPSYPWNRDAKYWHESRIAREFRAIKFPHHELLGSRVVQGSQIEPSWRNLLQTDKVPWCRDHRLGRDIVFPATGYLSMAGEAMRQLSGAEAVSMRQVTVAAALILNSDATETILSMSPHKLTTALDSNWYEFSISSYNETSASWTRHCFGQVKAADSSPPKLGQPIDTLPRKVDTEKWYKTLQNAGMNYGPHFRDLDGISAHPAHNTAVARLRLNASTQSTDNDTEHAPFYYFHPTASDACLQLFTVAMAKGQARNFHTMAVPTYIEEAYFRNPGCTPGQVTVEATVGSTENGGFVASCVAVNSVSEDILLRLDGVKVTPLDDDNNQTVQDPHAGARMHWKPDFNFQDFSQLLVPTKNRVEAFHSLQSLVLLCCIDAHDRLAGIETPVEHLSKFGSWIRAHVSEASLNGYAHLDSAEVKDLFDLSSSQRVERMAAYHEIAKQTEHATIGDMIWRVHSSMEAIFRGDTDALEILHCDDGLTKLYNLVNNAWDYGPFLRLLSHRSPRLRILEIGAGTGGTTEMVLAGLTSFQSYTSTDISAGFFPAARERFRHVQGMQFKTLDISRDPLEQDFAPGSFDLIVAANVLHATPRLRETLANVRKLLRPEGMLLLQELGSTQTKWFNFIMGPLSGWWLGDADGRSQEPYVSAERWASDLSAAGFSSASFKAIHDGATEPFQLVSTIVASPEVNWKPDHDIEILSAQPNGPLANDIANTLQARGLRVDIISLADQPTKGVISILDLEGAPALEYITTDRFRNLKAFFSALAAPGILWLTKACQIQCREPQYAPILGLMRTLRNELGMPIATLELDDWTSAAAINAVYDVYQKVQRTHSAEPDERADPDSEFAYSRGTVYLPRYHGMSVTDELATTAAGAARKMRKRLEVGKKGILNSLRWVERPEPGLSDLEGQEITIDVKAVGMNFKDTLIAMGMVKNDERAGDGFGLDCSGVVRTVGPNVTDVKVGDRVMAVGDDAYATVTKAVAYQKIPDELSFEDAAGMPAVYSTAIYGLLDLAKLEKDQTVLIHSACGGVGIAALNVCRMVGTSVENIYATVGNEEKVQFLMVNFGIPRSHIFNSRDASFRPALMLETAGRGVDIVLNSLSGELLHASWECVAEFGCMVELGKRDFIDRGLLQMSLFEQNRAFFGVDVGAIKNKNPRKSRDILRRCIDYYKTGSIQPIRPIQLLDVADMPSAIRTMQKGQHIGKLIVQMPEDDSTLDATPARELKFLLRSDASYLLAGGLGGLGRSISTWMAEHGAKNLVFISRGDGKRPNDVALIQELDAMGCTVQIISGSTSEVEDVRRATKEARLPIAGVLQLSMVLKDNMFANMPFEDWNAAMAPKVEGTWNLHEALAGQPLDFFILCSSFGGIVGQQGQSNYAAANTFLDAFVQFRRSQGLPAWSIDLGVVDNVGYVSERKDLLDRMKDTHHYTLREQDVLDGIELAIKESALSTPANDLLISNSKADDTSFVSDQQITLGLRTTLPLSDKNNRATWKRDPRFSSMATNAAGVDTNNPASGRAGTASDDKDTQLKSFLAAIEANPQILAEDTSVNALAHHVGAALGGFMMKAEVLDPTAAFATLGIDSLVAIEMRNWARQRLGVDVSVLEVMRAGNILTLAGLGATKLMVKFGVHVGGREGGEDV
ncbi:hypothetical protein B0T22DRAFT_425418 [Podospora appendiculata]|uniref:Polyketide synthase n=1 Tax=Podospora appendiculata TaxID=314037 RepID=A0AAE0X8F7_9PEZI|nr:hypothetical protein B0T22DRAFT_425418 [Podospora appendiculata]